MFAKTPPPPYYAVIFSSIRTEGDKGYGIMSDKMVALAQTMPGFLGIESARNEVGITVSYWENHAAILNWKQQTDHLVAQETGKKMWYENYKLRICLVERDYSFEKN